MYKSLPVQTPAAADTLIKSFNNYTPPAAPEPLEIPDNVIDDGNNYPNNYSQMSDARLLEEFKNYLSDEYYSFDEFVKSGNTIKITTHITDNVEVRRLQKKNPEIFTEMINRFDKIVFYGSILHNSITVNKLEE